MNGSALMEGGLHSMFGLSGDLGCISLYDLNNYLLFFAHNLIQSVGDRSILQLCRYFSPRSHTVRGMPLLFLSVKVFLWAEIHQVDKAAHVWPSDCTPLWFGKCSKELVYKSSIYTYISGYSKANGYRIVFECLA